LRVYLVLSQAIYDNLTYYLKTIFFVRGKCKVRKSYKISKLSLDCKDKMRVNADRSFKEY